MDRIVNTYIEGCILDFVDRIFQTRYFASARLFGIVFRRLLSQ